MRLVLKAHSGFATVGLTRLDCIPYNSLPHMLLVKVGRKSYFCTSFGGHHCNSRSHIVSVLRKSGQGHLVLLTLIHTGVGKQSGPQLDHSVTSPWTLLQLLFLLGQVC